jgi:hypothetical protein
MAIRKSSSSGIPFGNTAGRPANPGTGQLYSNGETARLELYTATGWQNIVQETPGVASATGVYNQSSGSGTFIVSGTNFVDGAIAYAVGTNGIEYQATSATYNSLVQLTVVFSNLSVAYEPYDIKITNPSNLFGLLPDAFYINDNPIWSTNAGSLGTFNYNSLVSLQLAATDDESNSLTYTVSSGSLPSGLSLSSSGLISGTIVATGGTSSFTISVSDGINTAQTRSFSITCVTSVVSGGTLSSDSTYYYRTFTNSGTFSVSNAPINAEALIVAGGGGGWSGGGGAGGLLYYGSYSTPKAPNGSALSLTAGSYSVVIGAGGAPAGAYKGSDTTFNGLTAFGGGGSQGTDTSGPLTTQNGGSGGGGGRSSTATPNYGGSGVSGQGNAGGTTTSRTAPYPGSGGGGAGAVGESNSGNSQGGSGGAGLAYTPFGSVTSTGQNVSGVYYYAGGGGSGGTDGTDSGAGLGGLGGGGRGSTNSTYSSVAGISNTGGGGGGGAGGGGASSAGGSGIVIIRYTKASVGG